jgi:hypothetical protein
MTGSTRNARRVGSVEKSDPFDRAHSAITDVPLHDSRVDGAASQNQSSACIGVRSLPRIVLSPDIGKATSLSARRIARRSARW